MYWDLESDLQEKLEKYSLSLFQLKWQFYKIVVELAYHLEGGLQGINSSFATVEFQTPTSKISEIFA